jgi:NDP-sugar pyrophosphorylase family protein
MTVFHNKNQWDRSNVLYTDGQVIRYDKHQPTADMEYIDYGLGILQSQVLDSYPADRPFDLATVYRDLTDRGQMAGFEVSKRFYEIGSFTGLDSTREQLRPRSDD